MIISGRRGFAWVASAISLAVSLQLFCLSALGQYPFKFVNVDPPPNLRPQPIVFLDNSTGKYVTANGLAPGASATVYLIDSVNGDWSSQQVADYQSAMDDVSNATGNSIQVINMNYDDPDLPPQNPDNTFQGASTSAPIYEVIMVDAQFLLSDCGSSGVGCTNPNPDPNTGYSLALQHIFPPLALMQLSTSMKRAATAF